MAPKPAQRETKTAPKSKAAPKTKVLVARDDNADGSGTDAGWDGGDSDDEGPRPAPMKNGKKKTVSETYTKVWIALSLRDTC